MTGIPGAIAMPLMLKSVTRFKACVCGTYGQGRAERHITAMKQNDTNTRKSQFGVFLIRGQISENEDRERSL
jgi:hypothetical protein